MVNSTTTGYVYDGLNFVQEKNGTGSGASVTANLLTGGIDQTFLRSSGGTLTSYLTDALGSSTNGQQYTGRENDGTGLYYYRARYYHPTLARFISEDPIGWAAGQTNQYAYVGGSPVGFTDPSGTAIAGVLPYIGSNAGSAMRALGWVNPWGALIGVFIPTPMGDGTLHAEYPPGYWPADSGSAEWGRRNGVGGAEGRRRFHGIKQSCPGSRATDAWGANPETGDVIDPEGESWGNLGEEKAK